MEPVLAHGYSCPRPKQSRKPIGRRWIGCSSWSWARKVHRVWRAELAYRLRERFAAGFGGMPFMGDPDHVASELARIAGWGFDGVIFGFVNYLEELPFFAQEVLPRLERM